MLALAPSARTMDNDHFAVKKHVFPASGERKGRVALLSSCVDSVVRPSIREAAIRLLNRTGIEVVLPVGEACCGSLTHHMGRENEALRFAKNNIDVWIRELEADGLDALLMTASGCGTTIKDYGFMLRNDPEYGRKLREYRHSRWTSPNTWSRSVPRRRRHRNACDRVPFRLLDATRTTH